MKEGKYEALIGEIQKFARKKRLPIKAMFELTYRCNFRCFHCYNTEEQKSAKADDELRTKEVFTILEQLKDAGCLYLGFTGGEIFCRADALDIIWYTKKLGFDVILLTNGSLINKRIADALKDIMLNKVDITVHAMTKRRFEKITRTSGSFERVFKAIALLHERSIPLGLKTCGMQENKQEVLAINRFARKVNALYRLDSTLLPRSDGSSIPPEHAVSLKEALALRKKCYPQMFSPYDARGNPRKLTKPPRENRNKVFSCGAGHTDVVINPYGQLKVCLEIDYPKYSILKHSFLEGWQLIKDFVDSLKPPRNWACLSCGLFRYCNWCPAKGYLHNGNFFTCASETYTQAKFNKQVYESWLTPPKRH